MPKMKIVVVTYNPEKSYTKANYARKIKKSSTWVNELIRQGKLREHKLQGGGSFVEEIN